MNALTTTWGRALVVLVVAACTGGCVERSLTVRSEPSGARVYYNDEYKGTTPCRFTFWFYGQPELRLEHPGYEVHKETLTLEAPWYQWPVLDAVSELVVPATIEDRRSAGLVILQPRQQVDRDALVERADQLKRLFDTPLETGDPDDQ